MQNTSNPLIVEYLELASAPGRSVIMTIGEDSLGGFQVRQRTVKDMLKALQQVKCGETVSIEIGRANGNGNPGQAIASCEFVKFPKQGFVCVVRSDYEGGGFFNALSDTPYFTVTNDRYAFVQVSERTVDVLSIRTRSGKQFHLLPVPMSVIPSERPENWLKFLKDFVPGSQLAAGEVDRVQSFMRQHHTEALTDGVLFCTLADDMLAYCDPDFDA